MRPRPLTAVWWAALAALVSATLCGLAPAQALVITSPSAQEYLGQFTHFRGWTTRRRLYVVKASDAELEQLQREAIYGYRCELAIRNVNLVLLADSYARETVFLHSSDNRRDFVQTNELSDELRVDLYRHLSDLYRELPNMETWAVLLGYDGGRKRLFRRVSNFLALIERIDASPDRRREEMLQKTTGTDCKSGLAV